MITAENITDEQIRELRDQAVSFGLDDVETHCDVALGENPERFPRSTALALMQQGIARARCAEILNARAKESK